MPHALKCSQPKVLFFAALRSREVVYIASLSCVHCLLELTFSSVEKMGGVPADEPARCTLMST